MTEGKKQIPPFARNDKSGVLCRMTEEKRRDDRGEYVESDGRFNFFRELLHPSSTIAFQV